jgi:hypothetical protein
MSARTRSSAYAARNPTAAPKEKPAKMTGSVNSRSSQSRAAHIFDFADAVGVLAFAQTGAAEVEAQHRESEAVERFHGVEDDFVVERSTVERMRMVQTRRHASRWAIRR